MSGSTGTQSSASSGAAMVEEEEAKALQLKTDRAFTAYFHSLPVRPDTVRLFDRKTFFSAHGSDARFLADMYFKSGHALRVWDRTAGTLPLEYVAVREGIEYRAVLRLCLVEQRRKVEVYAVSPRTGKWELAKRASPGNFDQIDDDVFLDEVAKSAGETAVAAAVALAGTQGSRVVGVAYVDFAAMELGVLEFPDDDQLTNLECALLQVGAKECYIPEARADSADAASSAAAAAPGGKRMMDRSAKKLRAILDKCRIPYTECKHGDYSRKDIEQDLGTLLGTVLHNLPELELVRAMEALACLTKNLGLLQMIGTDMAAARATPSAAGDAPSSSPSSAAAATTTTTRYYRLKKVDLSRYMKLDYAALRALNLVPGAGEARSAMNLYNLLNRCMTPMGARRLLRWVKQPLLDVGEINQRLDVVEEFVEAAEARKGLCECLKSFADLDRLCKKLTTGKATLQDTVILYDSTVQLEQFVRLLDALVGSCVAAERAALLRSAYAEPLAHQAAKLKKYATLVEHLVDLDKAQRERVFEINTGWSEQLGAVDARRARLRERMERLALQAAQDLCVKSVKLAETSQWGWVLRITKSDEKKLRDYGRRYTALDKKGAGASAGGAGVRFTCRDLEQLSAEHRACTAEYDELSRDIIAKVLEVARSYVPVFEAVSDAVADTDALLSMAAVSASRNYVRPTLHALGTGRTVLRDSRHPCVEAAALTGDALEAAGAAGGDFIPNDIELDHDAPDGARFVIVTGPNMGGKSTYIRQAGVNVVMAQMGCFVPCREAEVSAVDCVLCRVGAGDSQLRGVSTFMAEMLETAAILATATPRSLVIVDELGRGTSTHDGFGLAWAIAEHLCQNVGCFAFFATHFHELTELAARLPHVRNLHVTASTVGSRLILQYKVRPGPCDRSFGIHVAELADFPQDVIAVARQKAAELEDFAPAQKKQRGAPDTPAAQELDQLDQFVQQFAALPESAMSSGDDEATLAAVQPLVERFLATADPATLELVRNTAAAPSPTPVAD